MVTISILFLRFVFVFNDPVLANENVLISKNRAYFQSACLFCLRNRLCFERTAIEMWTSEKSQDPSNDHFGKGKSDLQKKRRSSPLIGGKNRRFIAKISFLSFVLIFSFWLMVFLTITFSGSQVISFKLL